MFHGEAISHFILLYFLGLKLAVFQEQVIILLIFGSFNYLARRTDVGNVKQHIKIWQALIEESH